MAIEISLLDPERFSEWRKVTRRGFGDIPSPEHIARRRRLVEMDRCFAAMDGGSVVGTGSSHTFHMTVPGGSTVGVAGIASIATAATHRRQGVMTSMVTTLIRQARERGEPVAALMPSESSIYGRFGFGAGVFGQGYSLQTRGAELLPFQSEKPKAHYIDVETARSVLPAIWERASRQRAGWLDRTAEWWNYLHFDAAVLGSRGPFFVVNGDAPDPDGYAIYETVLAGSHGENAVRVRELVGSTDASRRALWRVILGIDLAVSVECASAPLDDPLWWMLANPRMLERRAADGMWLRLLDVASALKARAYGADGSVVIKVVDGFDPESSGIFALEAGGGRADCREVGGSPEIELGPAELGAAYLGATPLRVLVKAGRVIEVKRGAIDRFDRMFASPSAAWCPHEF